MTERPDIPDFPDFPDRNTSDAEAYVSDASAWGGAMPTWSEAVKQLGQWMDEQAGQLALAAEPSGIVFVYTFDSSTTDSDPGPGKLRLSSATQNAATVIRVDLVDNIGQTVTTLLDQLDDSTSTVKGYVRIAKVGDPTKSLIFAITALASPSGYRNITVTPVADSTTNPFAAGDHLVMGFVRNGDRGISLFDDVTTLVNVASPTSTVTTPIFPTDKGEIALKFGFALSTSAVLRVAFSNDNVNYTSNITVGSSSANHLGVVILTDPTADKFVVSAEYNSGLGSVWPSSPPDTIQLGNHVAGAVSITGGAKYARFSPASGNINSGQVYAGRGR